MADKNMRSIVQGVTDLMRDVDHGARRRSLQGSHQVTKVSDIARGITVHGWSGKESARQS